MDDPIAPAPDLFDEPPLFQATRRVAAIAPITPTSVVQSEEERHFSLRWRAAGVALVLGGIVAVLSRFPPWAAAALALFAAGMSLLPLPRWGTRAWLIAAASFFFAQCTTIFVNQPFTWPMRFGFSALLLTALALFRAAADD
jgi:hypothetical protein